MAHRDTAAFAEFAAARSGALFRAAYLMVGDHALAEDLLQEALTKTYVAWPRLRDINNAEAYTRKAITTTAISWWRRAHELDPDNWTYKRQAWTLVTTPEGATENDLLQGPNDVYAGNWLDDVIAAGGGAAYSTRPMLAGAAHPEGGCEHR